MQTPTVTEVVTGALQLLEVRTAESPVTPAEVEDGLTSLNDLMNEWNVDGINIGYESIANIEDRLHVKTGSIGAIKANLAIYIASEYGKAVSIELKERAKTSKKSLRASIPLNCSEFPDTLPIGSGNEGNNFTADGDSPGGLSSSRFYPANTRSTCN
ncbi:MAG: hypothetical protein IIB77_02090 [Proteobacteria bacterium]|nr:hypothetical protein [Pseudomonadota bacterium]